jgi:hypothetical protein
MRRRSIATAGRCGRWTDSTDGAMGEGIAVDAAGNIYTARKRSCEA